jgi:SAM-dependent methyltransferase
MMNEKIKPLATGLLKHVPGAKKFLQKKKGGTFSSRYCYAVWMRHLMNYKQFGKGIPESVAELGPGNSLGIGLSALLSGSSRVVALDVVKYQEHELNLAVFEELIELFKTRSRIPDKTEFPKVRPEISSFEFPADVLTDELLQESLSEKRLNAIRKEIIDINNPDNTYVKCQIPWHDAKIIESDSMDFIFSQAVLEHVEDLNHTYNAMHKWLKPAGIMSHTIDFKSHGITKSWNGHWTFNGLEWQIVKGGKVFLINREPYSKHLELNDSCGFKILSKKTVNQPNHLTKKQLSKQFRTLSEEDLTTSGAYILSIKN